MKLKRGIPEEEQEDPQDKELDNIMKEQYDQLKKTIVRPVMFGDGMKRCSGCHEFFDHGFMLDNQFYCKKCTIEDFKNFLEIRKEVEE